MDGDKASMLTRMMPDDNTVSSRLSSLLRTFVIEVVDQASHFGTIPRHQEPWPWKAMGRQTLGGARGREGLGIKRDDQDG